MAFPLLTQFLLVLAGYVQLRSVSVSWWVAQQAAAQAPLNLALVQAASVGIIFVVAFPHRGRGERFLEAVHVRPMLGGLVALCFLAGAGLQMPLAEIGNLVQEVWPISFDQLAYRHRLVHPKTWWAGVSALIALVLVAPVTEELLFRGWLMRDLQDQYGRGAALMYSSLLFGVAHLAHVSSIIYATIGGLVLGAVALRTRSTLGSIAMHAGVNALPLLLPVTLLRIEGFNTLDQDVQHISPWLLLLSLGVAASALTIIWRSTEDQTTDG
jgi:membrane protease YdiL (CAAX protease family)